MIKRKVKHKATGMVAMVVKEGEFFVLVEFPTPGLRTAQDFWRTEEVEEVR